MKFFKNLWYLAVGDWRRTSILKALRASLSFSFLLIAVIVSDTLEEMGSSLFISYTVFIASFFFSFLCLFYEDIKRELNSWYTSTVKEGGKVATEKDIFKDVLPNVDFKRVKASFKIEDVYADHNIACINIAIGGESKTIYMDLRSMSHIAHNLRKTGYLMETEEVEFGAYVLKE